MTLGRWIHANLVYRAAVIARGEGAVFRILEALKASQFHPAERLRSDQEAALAAILSYTRTRSPFYRNRWEGSSPDLSTGGVPSAQLAKLPFVTKHDLQSHLDQLLARPSPGRVTRKTTGGSTGQAVTVVKDRAALAHELAVAWLGYSWFGVSIGDKQARFWGRPHSVRRRLKAFATRIAVRRLNFSAFAFDDRDLSAYWRACQRERPEYFYGYVSMLEAFAHFIRHNGLDGRGLGLKVIVTTSEVLTAPQRRLLEDTFGAPVQNEYGCGEVGPIAYECPDGGLHLMTTNLFVEVLRDDGEPAAVGESGHVVVTDLKNRAMPLIRYRLGDMAIPAEPCRCGRGLPTLERVWGREYDFVQDSSGRRYHGEYVMYMFEDLRDAGIPIEQFQLVQSTQSTLDVAIVTSARPPHEVLAAVERMLQERLPLLTSRAHSVSTIERPPSGKLRLIRNEWLAPAAPSKDTRNSSEVTSQ